MKQLTGFLAVLALTFIAFFPAAARADDGLDGLDVTMIVLDDEADLSDELSRMDGPDGEKDVDEGDWEDGLEEESDGRANGEPDNEPNDDDRQEEPDSEPGNDEFEEDEIDEDEELENEDQFDDGDDVDEDEFIEEEEEDEMMNEEETGGDDGDIVE